jgi:hypothetical protein
VPKTPGDGRVRLEIAFEGGQIVSGSARVETADGLRSALASDELVFDLETEDGVYVVALRKVVYVRRTAREMHIGFGTDE